MGSKESSNSHGDGELATLLEEERRLESVVEASRREAAAVVAAAEGEAHDRLAQLDAELERQRQALSESIEAGSAKLVANLARAAEASVDRCERLSEAEFGDLAAFVVDKVVGSTGGGSA